jgi:hypothetical protein
VGGSAGPEVDLCRLGVDQPPPSTIDGGDVGDGDVDAAIDIPDGLATDAGSSTR